jgi:hypothetical protein
VLAACIGESPKCIRSTCKSLNAIVSTLLSIHTVWALNNRSWPASPLINCKSFTQQSLHQPNHTKQRRLRQRPPGQTSSPLSMNSQPSRRPESNWLVPENLPQPIQSEHPRHDGMCETSPTPATHEQPDNPAFVSLPNPALSPLGPRPEPTPRRRPV